MPKVIQINTYNGGSTGNIAQQINEVAKKYGWETYLFFGRFWKSKSILDGQCKIASGISVRMHALLARVFDGAGLFSLYDTWNLIKMLRKIRPDIIHLHNIHGYYINIPILFNYLQSANIQVVWTLHDCWSFTGHCAHFDLIKCKKWKSGCYNCPIIKEYPKSFFDFSKRNYKLKRKYFSFISEKLTLIPVSDWLMALLQESFLKNVRAQTIRNGINTNIFNEVGSELREKYSLKNKIILLGVASPWSERKGLNDFIKLYEELDSEKYAIVLIGLTTEQIDLLPNGIIKLTRTSDAIELAQWYSTANIFINTTYEDNFPTVNIEALACGTPVITYNTGGCSEAITNDIGIVVKQGSIEKLKSAIEQIAAKDKSYYSKACRNRAIEHFDKSKCYREYVDLYNKLLNNA